MPKESKKTEPAATPFNLMEPLDDLAGLFGLVEEAVKEVTEPAKAGKQESKDDGDSKGQSGNRGGKSSGEFSQSLTFNLGDLFKQAKPERKRSATPAEEKGKTTGDEEPAEDSSSD